MKQARVDYPGSIHDFEKVKDLNEKEALYKCKHCGIEGTRFQKSTYLNVVITKKNTPLIENCNRPNTKGDKELTMSLRKNYDEKKMSEMAIKLAKQLEIVNMIKLEKQEADSKFKARIDEALAEASKFGSAILKGGEEIPTQVIVYYNTPTPGKKIIKEKDNPKNIIFEGDMVKDDYTIFNQPKEEPKKEEKEKEEKKVVKKPKSGKK